MPFALFLFLLSNCKSDTVSIKEIEGKDGLKEFHFYNDNGIKDSIHYLKDDILFCKNVLNGNQIEIENYYTNGKIESKGSKKDELFFGKWQYYSKDGHLLKELEYKIICNSSYLNQGKFYDENGNLDTGKSNFYEVFYGNGYKVNQKFELVFKYYRLYPNSVCELHMSPEVDDSFCDLEKNKFLISRFSKDILTAKIGFASAGKKNIRGFIKEEFLEEGRAGERLMYIDIPLVIKSGEATQE